MGPAVRTVAKCEGVICDGVVWGVRHPLHCDQHTFLPMWGAVVVGGTLKFRSSLVGSAARKLGSFVVVAEVGTAVDPVPGPARVLVRLVGKDHLVTGSL